MSDESKIGTIGIVVEDMTRYAEINELLHEHSDMIVGRLGIPYRSRGVAVISVVVDGSNEQISALTGKLGKLKGVSIKAAVAKG